MKNKVEWFSKYINCELLITDDDGRRFRDEIQSINWKHYYIEIGEGWIFDRPDSDDNLSMLLILKELKDISDEDMVMCNNIASKVLGCDDVNWDIESKEITTEWFFLPDVLDFLRPKGYAIGIPKEYYITEKELEEGE